ncbi:transmembrane protein [Ceratobasidium sp. AG-Ba]|nr:transmembrane protein [Ceratobasidium sp. AG-Ba]QRW14972.1 transmembrane protein [Ceratobasidium sp. AG-Ba]
MALDSGAGTGIFFLFAIGIIGFLIIWWAIAVYAKQKRQRALLASGQTTALPASYNSRFGGDPVVRAEAGENADGLPKYSAQARVDEQTVDRNNGIFEMMRPNWMSRPSMFRQATLPAQPPPAYDPSAPRPS